MTICSICGASDLADQNVLWPELTEAWQLSDEEITYVNRQQGRHCTQCHANLRIMALGCALRSAVGARGAIRSLVATGLLDSKRILDLNGAAGLSDTLSALPHYVRADFPDIDMHRLPYPDGSFDLLIHSDTLEHVAQPVAALESCRRVLSAGGRLCFTVPVIVGRLTRNRAGLAPSYHGNSDTSPEDFLVHTEYGADAWTQVLRAGFSNVTINHVEYPAALAMTAWVDTAD